MAFLQVNLFSESLMRTVNVNVILPADNVPAPDAEEYKTLYLLHGIFGSQNDWITGTNVQRWALEKNLAVVMPAGENMFYLDQEDTHALYGQFIGRELPALMRRMFRLSPRREDSFIAGLSMGGYGALRNGLKYADQFGAIAGLSSANIADGIEQRTDDAPRYYAGRRFARAVFGPLEQVKDSDQDIAWAARLAAAYSKGGSSSRVPVDYTLRRYVKKPGGAKPGFVIYTNQRTLFVQPAEEQTTV